MDVPEKEKEKPKRRVKLRIVATQAQLDRIEAHARAMLSAVESIRAKVVPQNEIRNEIVGNSFGERVVSARKAAGMKQFQLAVKAGMAAAQLCQIENGKVCPSIDTALRIAQELGESMDSLCGR